MTPHSQPPTPPPPPCVKQSDEIIFIIVNTLSSVMWFSDRLYRGCIFQCLDISYGDVYSVTSFYLHQKSQICKNCNSYKSCSKVINNAKYVFTHEC